MDWRRRSVTGDDASAKDGHAVSDCLDQSPTISDMMSNDTLGKQPREDGLDVRRSWRGISLFDTAARARKLARRQPWHGNAFIAELLIPLEMFQVEATRSRGHTPSGAMRMMFWIVSYALSTSD